jgi:hypothetical protein
MGSFKGDTGPLFQKHHTTIRSPSPFKKYPEPERNRLGKGSCQYETNAVRKSHEYRLMSSGTELSS